MLEFPADRSLDATLYPWSGEALKGRAATRIETAVCPQKSHIYEAECVFPRYEIGKGTSDGQAKWPGPNSMRENRMTEFFHGDLLMHSLCHMTKPFASLREAS